MHDGLASEKPPHGIFMAFLEERENLLCPFPLKGGPGGHCSNFSGGMSCIAKRGSRWARRFLMRVFSTGVQCHPWLFGVAWGLIDSNDLKELRRAIKKLQKSGVSVESLLSQLVKLPSKEKAPGECALELPTPSLFEGQRIIEDLVQSLLLPVDMLKMHKTNHPTGMGLFSRSSNGTFL